MIKSTLTALQEASSGLLYMSETDAPFDLVHFPVLDKGIEEYLKALSTAENKTLLVRTLDDFLRNSMTSYETDTAVEKERVERFQHLKEVLNQSLQDIRIYQIGTIQSDIYILGRVEDQYAGLHTCMVQT